MKNMNELREAAFQECVSNVEYDFNKWDEIEVIVYVRDGGDTILDNHCIQSDQVERFVNVMTANGRYTYVNDNEKYGKHVAVLPF